MEQIEFPSDFSEFLRLLNAHGVEYLIVGGFAVAIHGYPRATADMDVWIARTTTNARRVVAALDEFGFGVPDLKESIFLNPDRIVRMGVAPIRIEIMNSIDGVEFDPCYERADTHVLGGVPARIIGLEDLKTNKRASARNKDLADLDNLP
jgi:predicted nucleotidyltransferase